MNRQPKQFYEFGPFCLDIEEGRLLRDGQALALTPKAFETLRLLVENSGQILEKEELIQKVWPDVVVEEGGLTRNISVLRKVLTNGVGEACIQTIPRRGYRFTAKVRKRVEAVPSLRWIGSQGREEIFLLRAEEIVVGRKSDADLVLENPYISRHHAKLMQGPQGYRILDLDSSHGTFVNGQRIASHELKSGDRIALGKERVELVYYTDEGDTAGKETNRQDTKGAKKS